MTLHLDRIAEGLCPDHGTPLERREDFGWCEACQAGWRMTQDTVGASFYRIVFGPMWRSPRSADSSGES